MYVIYVPSKNKYWTGLTYDANIYWAKKFKRKAFAQSIAKIVGGIVKEIN